MQQGSSKNEIAVVGELNVDLVAAGLESVPVLGHEMLAREFEITLGSASAIFACGVARLGRGVTFVSRVGADHFGRFCLGALAERGISTDLVHVAEDSKTGVTVVLSTPQDRALVTYLGAIAELRFDDIPVDALAGHRHLHCTSYFLQTRLRPDFLRLMSMAKGLGLSISFDPNSDPSHRWDPEIYDVIGQSDILFLSESEAKQLTAESEIEPAMRRLSERCQMVVVKRGAAGATAMYEGNIISADGFAVEAIDSVGAGDSFDAGFVHAYLDGAAVAECLAVGNACGAHSVTRAGGTTAQPDRAQVAALIEQQGRSSRATVN